MDVGRFPIDSTPVPGAHLFRRRLLAWYQAHGRDLPWRRTRDPYAILVSELMLQQTQVTTVIPYYNEWLRRFPDFRALAHAAEAEVLHAWQGLGYYARARNLHAAAKRVVAQHDGNCPASPEQMRKLPGVGRYTANAVATFAFDQAVPIVEANTARVLARLSNLLTRIDSSAGEHAVWDLAGALVPKRGARAYNSALIDLGALVCTAGQPKCPICPVRGFCRAENPLLLPVKKSRPALKRLTEYHGFAVRRGRVLLEQSRGRWRGMWILPHLIAPQAGRLLHAANFPFTRHRIRLEVFAHQFPSAQTPSRRWFALEQLSAIPLPSPHRRAIDALLASRPQKLGSTSPPS